MNFNKDFKNMTLAEKKADPDWQELSALERLAALGMLRDTDDHIITLEEQYNERFLSDEEKAARMEEQRKERKKKMEERARKRAQNLVNQEFEELTK